MRTWKGTISSIEHGEAIVAAADGQRVILRGVNGLEVGQSIELELPAAFATAPTRPARPPFLRVLVLWFAIIVCFVAFYSFFQPR